MRFIYLLIVFLAVTRVVSQPTVGYTTIGTNSGTTANAPCTEILKFDNYNDTVAGTGNGQNFVFVLQSGDSLFFNLVRTGTPIAAVTAPCYLGAAFGQYGYNGLSGNTVLYQVEDATNSGLNFSNIHVKNSNGQPVTNYTLVILDGEATNVYETFITTVAPQSTLYFWDSITPPTNTNYATPAQSGLGTNSVTWGPAPYSEDYQLSYAIATDTPGYISMTFTHNASGLEGVALGISRKIGSPNDTVCVGKLAGIQLLDVTNGISVYPNPNSTSNWHIKVGVELIGSQAEIYDAEGRSVWNSKLETQDSELSFNFSSGIYFLHISSPHTTFTQKLVKF